MSRRPIAPLVASLLVASVAVGTSATPTAAARPPQLTGLPISIFMVNLEGKTGTAEPQISEAARAATFWVNTNGGIQGRPLKISICKVDATPETGKACLTQAAAEKPPVVFAAQPGGATESLSLLQAAGIPYVAETCNSSSELSGQFGSFCFSSSFVNFFSGTANYLKSLTTAKRVTLAYVNQPAIVGGVKGIALPLLTRAGITPTEVAIPDGAPDIAPTITTALSTTPDAHVSLTVGPGCITTMKVRHDTRATMPFVYPSLCADRDVLFDGGKGARGALLVGPTAAVDTKEPDVKLYRRQMAKYAPKVDPDDVLAQSGFAGIANLAAVLRQIPVGTDITPAAVTAALKGAKNVPRFLGGPGATFTCDGSVYPQFKALCSLQARVVEHVKNGKLVVKGTF